MGDDSLMRNIHRVHKSTTNSSLVLGCKSSNPHENNDLWPDNRVAAETDNGLKPFSVFVRSSAHYCHLQDLNRNDKRRWTAAVTLDNWTTSSKCKVWSWEAWTRRLLWYIKSKISDVLNFQKVFVVYAHLSCGAVCCSLQWCCATLSNNTSLKYHPISWISEVIFFLSVWSLFT